MSRLGLGLVLVAKKSFGKREWDRCLSRGLGGIRDFTFFSKGESNLWAL